MPLVHSSNDRAILNNKKTIGHDDVFASLKELEFANFLPRCQQELERYQALQCTKRNDYRKRIRDEQKKESKTEGEAGALGEDEDGMGAADGDTTFTAGPTSPKDLAGKELNADRPVKKAKMESGAEDGDEDVDDDVDEEDDDEDDEEEDDGPEEGQDEQDDDHEIDDDAVRPGPEQDGSDSEVDLA